MRNIHKSTPPSFRRRENAAAIVKAPPLGINFKNGPTPDRGAVPNPAKRRRHAFSAVAFLAVLAVGLLFLLPGGLLQAQDDGTIEYAENGTDPVATYTGIDPEGRPIYWSLLDDHERDGNAIEVGGNDLENADVVDYEDFTISSDGVLSFKFPPDFETREGAAALTATSGQTNTYKIVVVASDNAPGAETDANPIRMTDKKVTVTVTDVDEDGSISLSAQQPQEGVALTATLTDQDARSEEGKPIIDATWKWEQAQAMNGPWSLISGAGADDMDATAVIKASGYQPAADTVGKYLRATVTYTDKHGDDKTAMAVSAHAVRAEPSGMNSAPAFDSTGVDRSVDENSPPGTNVGKPVIADDAPGDILTYTMSDTATDSGHAAMFRIDPATGQITVGPRAMLDAEAPTYEVTVTATDPYGPPDQLVTQLVTITANDVNEAPWVNGGPTKVKWAEGVNDSPGVVGAGGDPLAAPTYTAADKESTHEKDLCDNDNTEERVSTCTWSLEGPDGADFTIGDGTGDTNFGELFFKNAPDFENPADADMDNVYEVTVKVTDNGVANKNKMSATRDVMITVTNADEAGSVTFSSVQPKVGRPFTAILTDPDGETTGVKWKWRRTSGEEVSPVVCSNNLVFDATIDEDSNSYTPKRADLYQCLKVLATYTDPVGPIMAMGASANAVVANTDNVAPEFKEGGDKPVMQATRYIEENSDAGALVVVDSDGMTASIATPSADPVAATDPNGIGDILTYTLGGARRRQV